MTYGGIRAKTLLRSPARLAEMDLSTNHKDIAHVPGLRPRPGHGNWSIAMRAELMEPGYRLRQPEVSTCSSAITAHHDLFTLMPARSAATAIDGR
jgi:hypothetical protein